MISAPTPPGGVGGEIPSDDALHPSRSFPLSAAFSPTKKD
ncbi:hypothetical protein DAD186_03880 [Dermabacter vaginalis]|uniref:Uncharacterized protein n=1 Tax=Dermabacter vaginalis TaxID=1630135 RepID=A0A1B0ZG57_9MICO|nr:hypothetical protein DAD186_03880 [Dermabacter vaginalis]